MNSEGVVFEDAVFERIAKNIISKQKESAKIYCIVQGRVDEVEREVQRLLSDGWVCQGGASHYQDWFAQAMIRDVYEQHRH